MSSCVICQEIIDKTQKILFTPCIHGFHEECLMPWIDQNKMNIVIPCPMCKTDISELCGERDLSQLYGDSRSPFDDLYQNLSAYDGRNEDTVNNVVDDNNLNTYMDNYICADLLESATFVMIGPRLYSRSAIVINGDNIQRNNRDNSTQETKTTNTSRTSQLELNLSPSIRNEFAENYNYIENYVRRYFHNNPEMSLVPNIFPNNEMYSNTEANFPTYHEIEESSGLFPRRLPMDTNIVSVSIEQKRNDIRERKEMKESRTDERKRDVLEFKALAEIKDNNLHTIRRNEGLSMNSTTVRRTNNMDSRINDMNRNNRINGHDIKKIQRRINIINSAIHRINRKMNRRE